MENDKRPVVALVATPKFKTYHSSELGQFVYAHLYTLTKHFDVISTGRTHAEICSFIDMSYSDLETSDLDLIEKDFGKCSNEKSLSRWRNSITRHFERKRVGVKGMIEIANDLVQGNLDAIIQFSMDDDTTVRAGSAVLRREANVHDVPIASDMATAHTFVGFWKSKLRAGAAASSLFRRRGAVDPSPSAGLAQGSGDRVLALIAHNEKKPEMRRFVREYARKLERFDHILATGHSGIEAKQSLSEKGWGKGELKKIRRCNSGPEGGDVQIAMAVIQGLCHNVVFFQDPGTSHPHEADIRLFEQAILAGAKVRLASNPQSARLLLDAIEDSD